MVDRGDQPANARGGRPPKRIAARAYAYAEGDGPLTRELELLGLIDRFGAMAIMGRTLGAGEVRRLVLEVGGYVGQPALVQVNVDNREAMQHRWDLYMQRQGRLAPGASESPTPDTSEAPIDVSSHHEPPE